jgi:V/A-type H+/Na+-transporting ATPase subunit D
VEEVRPTRSGMLDRVQQLALAEQGCDLLKRKRDALLVEFSGVTGEMVRLSGLLRHATAEAQYSLAVAQAVDGVVALRSAALATRGEIVLDVVPGKVMGVALPSVIKGESPVKSSFTRGYSVTGVSSRVDETAEKFERMLDIVIEYAAVETRLKRLSEEIAKTNRRVNALEQVRIPELRAQIAYISQTLDERGREELFALKKVKKKIESKRMAARDAAKDRGVAESMEPIW